MWLILLIVYREEIVIWARKKTGLPIIRVSSVIEANEYQKKHYRFVVGLFSKFEVCYVNSNFAKPLS